MKDIGVMAKQHINLPKDSSERIQNLLNWSDAVNEYPKGDLF